jgi:hypothetical protein
LDVSLHAGTKSPPGAKAWKPRIFVRAHDLIQNKYLTFYLSVFATLREFSAPKA